jgi:hypothetical protein
MITDPETSTAEDRAIVDDFVTLLPLHARKYFDRNPTTYLAVLAAVRRGWTPRNLARVCSDSLPTVDRAAAINRKLQYCVANDPPKRPVSLTTRPRRHVCNHPDSHVCPWLTNEDGSVARCGCGSPGGAA